MTDILEAEPVRLNLIEHGACAAFPTGWWMPSEIDENGTLTETYDTDTEEKAKEICGKCGLQAQCLDYALNPAPFGDRRRSFLIGIWGGKTLAQRRKIRKTQGDVMYERIVCQECGRFRKVEFFDDDGLEVCVDCRTAAMVVCVADGCGRRDLKAHGLCKMHYERWRRHGGTERKPHGRPRTVPSDDEMLADFRSGLGSSVLAEIYGVAESTVTAHRRRLMKQGGKW